MKGLFDKAMKEEIIRPCVEDLLDLWREYGCPEPPLGASTESVASGFRVTDVEEMGDDAQEADARAFTRLSEMLFELIDIRHVGSGICYTSYDLGTDAWQEYSRCAGDIIQEFSSHDMWDRFCALHAWEAEKTEDV